MSDKKKGASKVGKYKIIGRNKLKGEVDGEAEDIGLGICPVDGDCNEIKT